MAATKAERLTFAMLVKDHINKPAMTAQDVQAITDQIARLSSRYEAIQVAYCNDPMTEEAKARTEAEEAQLEQRIEALAKTLGCGALFQGDPRGATVKLAMPDGFTNDWAHDGVCAPGS